MEKTEKGGRFHEKATGKGSGNWRGDLELLGYQLRTEQYDEGVPCRLALCAVFASNVWLIGRYYEAIVAALNSRKWAVLVCALAFAAFVLFVYRVGLVQGSVTLCPEELAISR